MDKLKAGEVCELDNGKEYIVFSLIEYNGYDYVYLMSNFKPLEVRFAKQIVGDNDFSIEIINNHDQKVEVLQMFQEVNE